MQDGDRYKAPKSVIDDTQNEKQRRREMWLYFEDLIMWGDSSLKENDASMDAKWLWNISVMRKWIIVTWMCLCDNFSPTDLIWGDEMFFHLKRLSRLPRTRRSFTFLPLLTVSLRCQVVCLPLHTNTPPPPLWHHIWLTSLRPPTPPPYHQHASEPFTPTLWSHGAVITLKTVGAEGRCRVAACCVNLNV